MDKKGKSEKKRKLNIKPILIFLGVILSITLIILFILNIRVKRITINGNEIVKDVQIIEVAGLKDYPKLSKLNIKEMETNINNIPLITKVKIKRNILGDVKINVTEDKVYLYYLYNKKYVTSSNEMIDEINKFYGYPTLINFVPDTVLEEFVNALNKVDYNVIKMISEIEYSPYKGSDGTIIDEARFTLKMNDANTVIIDAVNIRNLNDYMRIFASLHLDETKGILYLDTITDENIYFKTYEEIIEEEPGTEIPGVEQPPVAQNPPPQVPETPQQPTQEQTPETSTTEEEIPSISIAPAE